MTVLVDPPLQFGVGEERDTEFDGSVAEIQCFPAPSRLPRRNLGSGLRPRNGWLIVRIQEARGAQAKVPKAVSLRSHAGASETCVERAEAGSFAGDTENQRARLWLTRLFLLRGDV